MAVADSKLLSDHFTPWSSPYHLLHPFMQPIMPTTILVLKKTYFTLWAGPEPGTWSSNNLGRIEKSNKTWKNKKLKQNQKTKKTTFGRMFGFDSNDFFFGFPSFFLLGFGSEMENPKQHIFFVFWMDMINQDLKKQQTTQVFFQHFRFGFLHWKVSKTKTTWVYLVFLNFDFLYPFNSKLKKN